MKCETAELELSARIDGERDRRLDDAVTAHLETCERCRAFVAGAGSIHAATRVRPAVPVPDLVSEIMAAVEATPQRRRLVRPRTPSGWLPYAAAFVAGALAVSVVAGGLSAIRRGPSRALAGEIPDEVAAAAVGITSYRATFEIVERNFEPRITERRFSATVAFRAPERFRAAVTDETTYPSESWTRNDFTLTIDERRWQLDAPRTCPREALPACAVVGRDLRSVVGRAPFESGSAMPTDIVLPVRTLVDVDRVEVVAETTALGRDAVVVALRYHDATPLFSYLHAAGTWRPFFPHDRVLVTLDHDSWFPLAYEVRAGSSVERDLWASHHGLPAEAPGLLLFRAEAVALGGGPAPAWHPIPSPGASPVNHGFVDEPADAIASQLGSAPPLPVDLAGLRAYASGVAGDRYVFAYARGLGWLTVSGLIEGGGLDVAPLARPVQLAGGSGLYEPATSDHGRRLTIDGDRSVVLETNLPRDLLMQIASSVPIEGQGSTTSRPDLPSARRALPGVLAPVPPPDGYRLWQVDARPGTVTITYLRPGSELDGTGIRLYQSRAAELPPPLDLEVLGVMVRGIPGRYSPERAELEWVEDGVYRSLQASGFDLAGLLRITESLEVA